MSDTSDQIKAAQQMAAAMQELTKTLRETNELHKDLNKHTKELSETDLSGLSEQHKKAGEAVEDHKDKSKGLGDYLKSMWETIKDITKQVFESMKRIGEATLEGLKQGFRNFEAIVMSTVSTLS